MSWIWFLYLRAPVKATVTAKQRFVHLRNGLANSTQATSLLLVTPVQTSELNTSSSCHPSFKVEPCAGSIVSAAVAARRSILVGGSGALPIQKSGGGATRAAKKFLLRFRKNLVLS